MLQEDEGGGGDFYDHPVKKRRLHNMDRMSHLPDPIVHHIMSFLTTLDITKISILSKRFFFLWSSYPVIDFDESSFARTSQGTVASITNGFLNHIQNSIRLRRIDTVLSEFRVKINLRGISADRRFNSAISFALDNGVKTMDLNLGFSKYQLPVPFASKSINVLRFNGLKLDINNLVPACPSLRTLSLTSCVILRDIKFSSQRLTHFELRCCAVKFINIKAPNLCSFFYDAGTKHPKPCWINVSHCQNIEYLSLNNVVNGQDWVKKHATTLGKLETFILNGCQDLENFRVCNYKLERIEIVNCPVLASIEVIAPALESFRYKGTDHNRVCNIRFIASKCIKDLSIENASNITDQWLETQLATSCCLESLRLKACDSLQKIMILHEKLQTLELLNCQCLLEAKIDTPQLVSFDYHGNIIEMDTMVTRSSCTATLSMKPWITYNNESFYGWRKLLSYFGHCKSLTLICSSEKELIMPECLRDILVPPLYDLQHLEIHIKSLEKIETDLVDSLLWLLPLPNTLYISSGSRSLQMNAKFVYKDTIKEEEDKAPFCCNGKPIKCWRHNLTRVEIRSSDANGSVELKKYFLMNAMMLDSFNFSIGLD